MIDAVLRYHILISFVLGYLLDLLFGDPRSLYHFVQFEGKLISIFDRKLNRRPNSRLYSRAAGIVLWILSVGITFFLIYMIINVGASINPYLGLFFETFFVYQCLATHSLKKESMYVHSAIEKNDLIDARLKLAYIVGRDTDNLDFEGIMKADVETIAENTSDGVISPIFYMALFGVYGGVFCKLVNTLDSMVGYKNDRYRYFGTFSARMDDVIQFIPARLTAVLMIAASFILRYDSKNGIKIFRRDRYKHASMNSAQSEATAAGILDVQLAGDAIYGGVVKKKPSIGDPIKKIDKNDIVRANRLLYLSSSIAFIITAIIMCGVH
ncbi:MAG: adenosylcobinamide-phosphate synthase CbiB [Sphaerochaeta sp.]